MWLGFKILQDNKASNNNKKTTFNHNILYTPQQKAGQQTSIKPQNYCRSSHPKVIYRLALQHFRFYYSMTQASINNDNSHEQQHGTFSGVQLPFILRQKVREAQAKAAQEAADGSSTKSQDKFMTARMDPVPSSTGESSTNPTGTTTTTTTLSLQSTDNSNIDHDRVFTSHLLETLLMKSEVALVEVQKQIYRGEEAYYEETFSHGNVFKGWEGYLDAKESSASGSGGTGTGGGSGPRMGRVPQGAFVRLLVCMVVWLYFIICERNWS